MTGATLVHRPPPPHDVAPRGAVIILVFGRLDDIGPCLEALRPTLPAGVAIILVDNGSPRDLTGELVALAPDAHILRAHRSRGYAAGNNHGAAHALALGAPLLYFLNDDTAVEPGFWEACAVPCAAGRLGIAGSLLVHHDRPQLVQYAGLDCDLTTLRDAYHATHIPVGPTPRATVACDAVFGAGFMVRADLYRRLGGIDESYGHLFEETDLCLRARAAGEAVALVGDSVVRHKGGSTLGYTRPRYIFLLFRNRLWMWRRLARPAAFWAYAPRRAARQLLSLAHDTPAFTPRIRALAAACSGIAAGFLTRRARVLPLRAEHPREGPGG